MTEPMNDLVGEATTLVILASASPSRAALLTAAGVPHRTEAASIDEEEVKVTLRAEGAPAATVAETLAELKARRVAARHREALVIGADQVLECDGTLYDKPPDPTHARAQLSELSGRTHRLHASVCVVRDAQRLWHHSDMAEMEMRRLSEQFIERYLAVVGDDACRSVGAYRLEGIGAQLFARVRGDYFTVLGLPLLPLLQFLREHGVLLD